MEDYIDIIVTETTNLIEITSQASDETIDVNIIDNREDITLNVTPTVVEININQLTGNFGINWGEITGTLSNQTDLNTALGLKADLVGGKVPSSQLPSYVDDVVEVANYAALPATGETGKIYITLDTNLIYRWTGSTYVEIKDTSAVWGAITGTLSSQTDLQSALDAKLSSTTAASTYVPYSGATSNVNLGTNDLTSRYLVANGGSALGGVISIKQDATYLAKGNGFSSIASSGVMFDFFGYTGTSTYKNFSLRFDGLTDNTLRTYTLPNASGTLALTSDLHNAVTIGTANGLSLSTQILSLGLASSSTNGALSSTDWSTFNGKQAALSGTGFVKISGTTISYDNASYLPLTGGTLTGTLNGTNITITNSLIAKGGTFNGGASYGGIVTIDGLSSDLLMNRANTSNGSSITLLTNAVEKWNIGLRSTGATDNFFIYNSNLTANSLTINSSNSAATFASSVTATAHIVSGGTSSQFQKGDGSLDSNTYLTTSSASSTYLAKSGGTLTGALSGTSATFSFANSLGSIDNNAYVRLVNTGASTLNQSIDLVMRWQDGTYNGTGGISMVRESATARSGKLILQPIDSSGNNVLALTLASSGDATFSSSITATYGGFSQAGSATAITQNARFTNSTTSTANGSGVGFDFALINSAGSGKQTGQIASVWSDNGANSAADLVFYTRTSGAGISEKVRITSNGNVGIGTTLPQGALEVVGLSYFTRSSQSTLLNPNYGGAGTHSQLQVVGNMALAFATNGDNERMRITSGGNVRINTSSDIYSRGNNLLVSGAETAQLYGYGNAYGIGLYMAPNSSATGTHKAVSFRNPANGEVGSITTTDSLTAYNLTSDYRLKQDLKSINGLDLVNKIKVYNYEWKSDKTRMDGVLAHELAEVLPYAVQGIKDGAEMQQVDYSKIVPVMVQAIKDLKAKIETLENK